MLFLAVRWPSSIPWPRFRRTPLPQHLWRCAARAGPGSVIVAHMMHDPGILIGLLRPYMEMARLFRATDAAIPCQCWAPITARESPSIAYLIVGVVVVEGRLRLSASDSSW
jgi:hypothetical protein